MRPEPAIDERYRSLLQKAVRRGHVDLALTVGACMADAGDPAWFERRTDLIALSECWPLSGRTDFTKAAHSKLAALVRVARARKDRDAAGLGFLSYALARGDGSVLAGTKTTGPSGCWPRPSSARRSSGSGSPRSPAGRTAAT